MGFYNIEKNQVEIDLCGNECVCTSLYKHQDECEILFAGFSKFHNKGIHYRDDFYMEKLAESWDKNCHDYRISIVREQIVKDSIVLEKLVSLQHPNLMKIKGYCECSVCAEYLPGKLLNSHKEEWLLGSRAKEEDYVDICSWRDLKRIFFQVGDALLFLHKNNICHTDPIDHNVIVDEYGNAKLIDLIGAMPLNADLMRLDNYVYLNRLIVPVTARINGRLSNQILDKTEKYGDFRLEELLEDLSAL